MRRHLFLLTTFLFLSLRTLFAGPFVGYAVVPAFTNLNLHSPVTITTPPGETNRLFILEKGGSVVVVTNLAAPDRTVFMTLTNKLDTSSECGLVGIAFHPNYATNGYFYLYYTPTNTGGTRFDRISRFQVDPTNPNAVLDGSEQILISQLDQAPQHQGADIHFGPDGYLYIPFGDEGGLNDQYGNSQKVSGDFFSGILRIDVDKKPGNLLPNPHPAITTNYLVPADNPFVGATIFNGKAVNPASVRTEFWAVGLRNPWRITFDAMTGTLYCGDVGQDTREEVDVITKGGNYGWNYREGIIAGPGSSKAPPNFSSINPIFDYKHGDATNQGHCVIGGVVYHGQKLTGLIGSYVFGDFVTGAIRVLNYNGASPVTASIIASSPGLCAFGRDPRDGEILIVSFSGNTIKKLDFKEDEPPTVKLLSSTNTVRVTHNPATLTGTATDDSQVTQVQYQLNDGGFQTAAGSNNWTFSANLAAGTNYIVIKAIDDGGHESTPVTVTRFFAANTLMTVNVSGKGVTSPNYNGKLLEVEKWYTAKGVAGAGYVFTNWSGDVTNTNAALTFLMQSNLVIQANFVTNPFIPLHGVYNGLFFAATNVGADNAGFINLTLGTAGSFSGTLKVDGISYSIVGKFSLGGVSTGSVVRFGKSTLQYSLQLNPSAPDEPMQGNVSDTNWSATLLAHRTYYTAANRATNWAGQYTVLLPPDANGPVDLTGFGYGLASISTSGLLGLTGGLADGSAISQSVPISKDGQCPIYVSLYAGQASLTNNGVVAKRAENKGFLLGWLSVSNAPDSIMTGTLNWLKRSSTNKYWPGGFTNQLTSTGSRFHTPARGVRVISFTNFTATFSGSVVATNLVSSMQLSTNNKITFNSSNTISLSLQMNLNNGALTGRFVDKAIGVNTIKGALLQQQNFGAGFFTGTNLPGAFQLRAQ